MASVRPSSDIQRCNRQTVRRRRGALRRKGWASDTRTCAHQQRQEPVVLHVLVACVAPDAQVAQAQHLWSRAPHNMSILTPVPRLTISSASHISLAHQAVPAVAGVRLAHHGVLPVLHRMAHHVAAAQRLVALQADPVLVHATCAHRASEIRVEGRPRQWPKSRHRHFTHTTAAARAPHALGELVQLELVSAEDVTACLQ